MWSCTCSLHSCKVSFTWTVKYRRDLKDLHCDNHKPYSSHLARAELSLITSQGSLDSKKQMHKVQSTYWKVELSQNQKKFDEGSNFRAGCKAMAWFVSHLDAKVQDDTGGQTGKFAFEQASSSPPRVLHAFTAARARRPHRQLLWRRAARGRQQLLHSTYRAPVPVPASAMGTTL